MATRRWLRAPLVHFLCAGGALFALHSSFETRVHGPTASTAGPPASSDAADLEDVLVRAALRLGFDDDVVVRRRIADNLAFVHISETQDRLASAMLESDPVVRRRLAQRMRLHLEAQVDAHPPTEAEIAAWIRSHAAGDAAPAGVRFDHLFFSSRPNGDTARIRAVDALERLRAGDDSVAGDAAPVQMTGWTTYAGAARYWGPAFAAGLEGAPLGEWMGPFASPFGAHVVLVRERDDGEPLASATRRAAAIAAIQAERRARAFAQGVARVPVTSDSP